MNNKIEVSSFTQEQLDAEYGTKNYPVGEAFRLDNHYFLQREHDVLHLNTDNGFVINDLHVGYINSITGAVKISYAEFVTKIKEIIYSNEIDKFWGA